MEITRDQHLQYMTKVTPVLIVATLIQSYLYTKFVPNVEATDVTLFLLTGVVLIVLGFWAHHTFHKVSLHPNYLKIKIKGLKIEEDLLYRDMTHFEVHPSKKNFSHVTINMRSGKTVKLFYLDNAPAIKEIIEKRKAA